MKKIDKQTIKAIRIVKGFNPDLRVKLKCVNEDSLYFWIIENRFGILGTDFFTAEPTFGTPEYDEFSAQISSVVSQVVCGF